MVCMSGQPGMISSANAVQLMRKHWCFTLINKTIGWSGHDSPEKAEHCVKFCCIFSSDDSQIIIL